MFASLTFGLKKAVEFLLEPLTLVLIMLTATLLLHRSRRAAASILTLTTLLLLLTCSLPRVSWWLARGLEQHYAPATPSSPRYANVRAIVVLSGGYASKPGQMLWDEMDVSSLRRTLEGIRLAKALPGTTLILSGGNPWHGAPPALAMAQLAVDLGISPARLRTEAKSRDTADQATMLAPQLGTEPFLLVTSAFHLPRSEALFSHAGTAPLAAPTDFLSGDQAPENNAPDLQALRASQLALHEYLGLLWVRVHG